jgi:hypothetical protein
MMSGKPCNKAREIGQRLFKATRPQGPSEETRAARNGRARAAFETLLPADAESRPASGSLHDILCRLERSSTEGNNPVSETVELSFENQISRTSA